MKKSLHTIIAVLICFGFTLTGRAADILITMPQSFATLDASDGAVDGIFTVTGNLTIGTGGSINNNDIPGAGNGAGAIKIIVSGNMEIAAGAGILAENRFADGHGGDISFTVGGTYTMRSLNILPAMVSSGNLTATSGNMQAGAISVQATDIKMEAGSMIQANAYKGRAGNITFNASNDIAVNAFVVSQSGGTGAGNNQGHGGTITLTAVRNLLINDNGIVSSRGLAPGADLVHLCGCTVTIWGLVESTGSGHAIPNNPSNEVSTSRPDKSANTTAAVEIWAGNNLIIDNFEHHGQVNADLCCSGGTSGKSWIDIFSKKDITITGGIDETRFAVHANGQSGNTDDGGQVTVKAKEGTITATGHAIMANGTSAGGSITIEGSLAVNLDNSTMYATGDYNAMGGLGKGGNINVRSFNNTIEWQNAVADVRPTGTHASLAAANRGVISAMQCTPGMVNVSGTDFPISGSPATTPTFQANACTGSPELPSYVSFCECPTVVSCVSTLDCTGSPVIVDQNVTIDFNQVDPNNYYSGDADLKPFFTYDLAGATADQWRAIFNLVNHKMVLKTGVTITVIGVGGGNNQYAPGITFNTNCEVEIEAGGQVAVESLNRQAGNLVIEADGNILINGEIRNEVKGTNGLPGAVTIKSKFGNIIVGQSGRVFDLGLSAGGNLVTLSTCGACSKADIIINGLVKSFSHGNSDEAGRPGIRVVAINGAITINANTSEPLYDEFTVGGGNYDIYGGLLSWVRDNNKPGYVKVQAKYDILVNGHGVDPTGPVRNSFGAIAAVATASSAPGGLVDVRSLEGNILADNRAFDVSGRNRLAVNYAHINLAAKQNILLTRTGADNSFNPVLDASSPGVGDHGGLNTIRSYSGNITIGTNALVSAAVPAGNGSTQGSNQLVSCVAVNNNGIVEPADLVTANDAGICQPLAPEAMFLTCNLVQSEGGPLPVKMNSFNAERNNALVNLKWETASELNAKAFILQRKTNGGFEDIASIPAANSANGSRYTYIDQNNFRGISAYRIIMVDLDGKVDYSETRMVKGISTMNDFTIYPNPSKGNAKVTVTDIAVSTSVQLVDISGRVIKMIAMDNVTAIDLPNLQPGIYLVRIINKNTGISVSRKLTVVK